MTATSGAAVQPDLGNVPDLDALRSWNVAQCVQLAGRIRRFLVRNVTRTGGHLGANLSSVELTIALHRAFRSPETRIIWDTGHQTYTHKILTGRHAGFGSLRARHGLSGFPSRAESPHDLLENSHASVGPAWALGVAMATGRHAVVVIGDGALTGGVAFEALNAIGYSGAPVTVVINDNGRSYADTPSRLTFGEPLAGDRPTTRPGAFFEALGFAYRGPVDGHDIAALDLELREASREGPCVVHVRTQKGHGWPAALLDAGKRLHDIGPGFPGEATGPPSWSAVIGDLLTELAATDDRIHVITAAMGHTLGLTGFQARFPGRYHDLGIAEQACVAMAAGLASQGKRPFFPVVTSFLTRALDQLLNDVALHQLPLVVLLDRAGVTGPDGPSHHGMYDLTVLRAVPGVEVYSPATTRDVVRLLRTVLGREHGPVVVRYPKGRPATGDDRRMDEPGLIREGRDACIVAHGPTVATALEAARILHRRDGLDCAIWRMFRVHPLDRELIDYAASAPVVIPVEEVSASGSLAAWLALELSGRQARVPRIEPFTLPAGFLPHGTREELLAEAGLTPQGLADFVAVATAGSLRPPAGRAPAGSPPVA